jgi:transcriptional regulator with XRE-family HTH domain
MSDSAPLGTVIRERRLEKGLSLGQLATKLGHTAASVRRWERSEDVPSNALIVRIAEVLDLDERALRASLAVAPAAEPAPSPEPETVPESEQSPKTAPAQPAPEDDTGGRPAATPKEEPAAETTIHGRPGTAPKQPAARDTAEVAAVTPEPATTGAAGASVAAAATPPVGQPPQAGRSAAPAAAATTVDSAVRADHQADQSNAPRSAAQAAEATIVQRTAGVSAPRRPAELTEAPTESVPVVAAAAQPAPSPSAAPRTTLSPPSVERPAFQNPFSVLFDPERRWLYWIRLGLLAIASIVLLYVFIWAVGELWDSLGELLDTIGSTEEGSGLEDVGTEN